MLLIRISDGVEQEVAVPNPIVLTKQENGALRKWSGPPTDTNLLQSWAYRNGYEVPEQMTEEVRPRKAAYKSVLALLARDGIRENEVAQRLLPFKLLQERKTKVKAHKSHSKTGKVYNVKQYDRDLRDAMAPKSVSLINKRAWKNTPAFIPKKYRLTDQESGALGENLVIEALKLKGYKKARALNLENPSAPFDAIYDRTLVEVKTGNAYNSVDAMKWSINFGGMSKEEKKIVRQMTPKQKKAYYKERFRRILKAKEKVIDRYEAKYGRRYKAVTVGVILNTRKNRADIYHIPGIHKQIRWRNVPGNYVYSVGYSL